jgi:AcrR family transcriptional regulator
MRARERMYHDLIFECAERLFAEKGFDDCAVQDIAAEAGISLKTLYATFPGKDAIYREIVAMRSQGLLEASALADPSQPALELLSTGVRRIVGYLIEQRAFFQILAREGQSWGIHPRSTGGREAASAGLSIVVGLVEQGLAEGVFLPADPKILGASVTALLQVQLMGLLERDPDPDPDAMADEILVSLRRLLCGGDGVDGQAETRSAD